MSLYISNSKSKLFINSFILITIVYSIVWGFAQFDNKYYTNVDLNTNRIENVKELPAQDILFLGSSYTYSAIIPEIISTEKEVYNMGVATAGPAFYNIVLDDLITSNKKPKEIVVGLTLNTFSSRSDNWMIYPIHRFVKNKFYHEEMEMRYTNFPYFKIVSKSALKGLFNLFNYFTHTRSVDNYKIKFLEDRGYKSVETERNKKKVELQKNKLKGLKMEELDKAKKKLFVEFIDKCSKNKIEVKVLMLPTGEFETLFSKNYLSDFESFVGQLMTVHKNVLDLRQIDLESSDYSNLDHLNKKGAMKISRKIKNL